jgi:ATP-dependent RNA helicase DDX24/MAK5
VVIKFIFSANLPSSESYQPQKNKKSSKQGSRRTSNVEGAIAEILEKARARGMTKVVDLSNSNASKEFEYVSWTMTKSSSKAAKNMALDTSSSRSGTKNHFQLPERHTLQEIKYTIMHKDSDLYCFLMTTEPGSFGPALVFCNSIAAVRRVGATLQTLGFPVRVLHAQMQQVRYCFKHLILTSLDVIIFLQSI